MSERTAEIVRKTGETDVRIFLDLDSRETSKNEIATGVGFLDHMLTLFSAHGGFRLDAACQGDVEVDFHHSVEDIGIALGQALKEALGEKKGITRYADIVLPMDEALMLCAIDISGRDYLGFDASFPTEKVGAFDTELVKEFWLGFVRNAGVTLHFKELAGENSHHIAESMFKAAGRVVAKAAAIDEKRAGQVPSTKGTL